MREGVVMFGVGHLGLVHLAGHRVVDTYEHLDDGLAGGIDEALSLGVIFLHNYNWAALG